MLVNMNGFGNYLFTRFVSVSVQIKSKNTRHTDLNTKFIQFNLLNILNLLYARLFFIQCPCYQELSNEHGFLLSYSLDICMYHSKD